MLSRCPVLARILGLHFPVVILDEHQDARPDQHEVAWRIADAGGARVRIFGDPMQAIYTRAHGDTIDWERLLREADERVQLVTPQRWSDVPELGEWIMRVREALRTEQPLPTNNRPASVGITVVPRMPDPRFGKGQPQFLSRPLHHFLDHCNGATAVLTYTNEMARDVHVCTAGRLVVNEGADFDRAYRAIEQAQRASGNRRELARLLVDLVGSISTGLNASRRAVVERALGDDAIIQGRSRTMTPLLDSLRRLYDAPTVAGFCAAATGVLDNPPEWLTIRLPETLRVLSRIRPPDDNPFEVLDAVVALRKLRPLQPKGTVSTIHKAKGMEFDHVFVCPFSATHFPASEYGRRLTYVALSRAQRSIEILVPALGPSPLIPT